MATFPNIYHLRRVAESSSKSCDVCYKPTTSVLFNPENKDFFYVCPGHLKDRGFATPIVDEAEVAAKKRKDEMDREIEKIKAEYEEKMKKKKEKEKAKKDKNNKEEKKEQKEKEDEDGQKAEKEKNEKINAITSKNATTPVEEIPRIYVLQKVFFQKRVDRIRNAEVNKRNQERLRNPTTFPSAPSGGLQ